MDLIIDTSTERSCVLFAKDGEIFYNELLEIGFQSSKNLFPAIQKGFQILKISVDALRRIAVAVGPGLYTGIRVGVAAAKGLVFPKKLPLIGFCNLSAFLPPCDGQFLSVIDGRSKGFYTLLQEKKGAEIVVLETPKWRTLAEIESFSIPLAGPFLERLSTKNIFECYPNAQSMISLIETQAQKKNELVLAY